MNVSRIALILAGLGLTASAASAQVPKQTYPVKNGPVTITACSLGQGGGPQVAKGSLEIKYFENQPGRTLTSITFRVNYNGVKVNVVDTGEFTYESAIDHHFDNSVIDSLTYDGPVPDVCKVTSATFADGHTVHPGTR